MKNRRRQSDPFLAKARLERVLTVTDLAEPGNDRDYWLRQSIHARLHHMELLRRINYGKAATGRLQRLLEVVQPKTR
jgi:hypothetical protein